jgi:starch phosphorylase
MWTTHLSASPTGSEDLGRRIDDLAARMPEPLHVLARLAFNLHWSWQPEGPGLWAAVDAARWERCGHNPVRLLQEAPTAALRRAAADRDLLARAAALEAALEADLARPAATAGDATAAHPVAFLCAEFGVHRSLPLYSGGLGVLAGDVLKQASDDAVPMVGIGLLYGQGYFRQRTDASGWQHEHWTDTDPDRLPAALVTGPDGTPLTVTVPIRGRDVVAQVWRIDVGRVPLLLLDADRPENDPAARWITGRLYVADQQVRLEQYALLGAGGTRALHALGVEPGVVHLNEGHASFAALQVPRERLVFTTHTPVPAGNDVFGADEVVAVLGGLLPAAGLDAETLVRRGRTRPDDEHEPFGVTQFALRSSRHANGVAARHGQVSREMWRDLWPDRAVDDVPIGHVTNGVHLPTWVGPAMRELLDRHLGADWPRRATDPATWAPLAHVPDTELWSARRAQRAALVAFVRARSVADRLSRTEGRDYAQAAAATWDPDVLTLGFARRLAAYKRLHLLLADPHRAARLAGGERPFQLVVAGKAHPSDDGAKRLLQDLFAQRFTDGAGSRVVFLDDHDLSTATHLVRGCDVWVNVPRPPMEASGTSGMKNAANGGLQLSVLDGWWPEGYDGHNGWAIDGEVDHDHGAQDHRHGLELLRLLEEEVLPDFYARDAAGIPAAWVARMRAALLALPARFGAGRMLDDLRREVYASSGTTRPSEP